MSDNIIERLNSFKETLKGKMPATINGVRVLPTATVAEILEVSSSYMSNRNSEMIVLQDTKDFSETSDVIITSYSIEDDRFPFKSKSHTRNKYYAFNGFKILCRYTYPKDYYGDYSEEIIEVVGDMYYTNKLNEDKILQVDTIEPSDYFLTVYEKKSKVFRDTKKMEEEYNMNKKMYTKEVEVVDFTQVPLRYNNELIVYHKHLKDIFKMSDSTIGNILTSNGFYAYKVERFEENVDYYSLSIQDLLSCNDAEAITKSMTSRQYMYLNRGKSKFLNLKGIEKFARIVNRQYAIDEIKKRYFDKFNNSVTATIYGDAEYPIELELRGEDDFDTKEIEMSSIINFNFDETEKIRVINDEKESPKFNLSDICKILDLQPGASFNRLKDDCKFYYKIKDRLGRVRKMMFVNEQGMFDLILTSRKPEAKAFREKITSEVLPKLMKLYTGSTNRFETVQIKDDNKLMTSLFEEESQPTSISTILKENNYVPDNNLDAYDILVECAIKLRDHQKSLNEVLAKTEDNSKKIESLQKQLEIIKPTVSINPNIDYCSLYMYARQNGYNLNFTMMDKLEKEADILSKEKGIFKDRIEDKMTGVINLYRHDICKELFNTKYQTVYDEEVKRQQMI